MSAKRFRVAFSFAGEKRGFVSQVAENLAERLGRKKILYDRFHEAEFARSRLGIYLPDLYHRHSDLVVVVTCKAYDERNWAGLEWAAIHNKLAERNEDAVMLCRFDRAHLAEAYGAGFIELDDKTPEKVAALILERLALLDAREPQDAGAPPRTSTPNNLPRLQSFFGREEELEAIREALDPENRAWGTLIDGPGGMGKTSLAIRAAYDCPPGLFDRIIFVSVKERELDDDGVRKVGASILRGFVEMLNELAHELGQSDIAKASESQRTRLLLDALRPARALIILDNLESLTKEDRDQLFVFVKRLPESCKAILTSRRRIGSGSELLILEKLDEKAALDTLADLAERNPLLSRASEAERLTLYHQTGGKPLLLRWVAGQLGRGSCRTFTDALHFLRRCPPDNDPLEFIFGDLAQEFTEDETKVLCTLTYFTLPAKVEHVAALAALEKEPVETALSTLANRSLVVPDQEETTFALVPMVADFLRRARPEVVAETGDRLEKRAYAFIVENGQEHYERFPALDAAWPTVAPALPLFLAGPNVRLQEVCDALLSFLDFTGRWDERVSLETQAEARALAAGDQRAAGWRSYGAGYVHLLRGEADGVLSCAERAETHWQSANVRNRERAFVVRLRGHGHRLKGQHAMAIGAMREALELFRALAEESTEVATALNDLGGAERDAGDLDAAERHHREALKVARAIGYAEDVAISTSNLGLIALDRERWPEAETLAREALALSAEVGRQELIGGNNYTIALALLRLGKPVDALPHARLAVSILATMRSPRRARAEAVLRECEGTPPTSKPTPDPH